MFKTLWICLALWPALLGAAPASLPPLEDPMRPSGAPALTGEAEETAPALRLESVIIRDRDRVAIISGQRLRVGDSVQGAKLTEIKPGAVSLRGPDGPFEMRFTEPILRSASSPRKALIKTPKP